MKRFLAILMLVILCCSLVACGKETTTTVVTNPVTPQETTAQQEADILTQMSQYVEKALGENVSMYDTEVDEESRLYMVYNHTSGVETDFELDLIFDGFEIKRDGNVKELVESGYEFLDPSEIESGFSRVDTDMNNTEKAIAVRFTFLNPSTSKKSLLPQDCNIDGFHAEGENVQYVDYQGITQTSTIDDIISKLGLPKSVRLADYPADDPVISLKYEAPFDEERNNSLKLEFDLTYAEDGSTTITNIYFNT